MKKITTALVVTLTAVATALTIGSVTPTQADDAIVLKVGSFGCC